MSAHYWYLPIAMAAGIISAYVARVDENKEEKQCLRGSPYKFLLFRPLHLKGASTESSVTHVMYGNVL